MNGCMVSLVSSSNDDDLQKGVITSSSYYPASTTFLATFQDLIPCRLDLNFLFKPSDGWIRQPHAFA